MTDPLFDKGNNPHFILCSRICNETSSEYVKRRADEYTQLTNTHPGFQLDHETMKGGTLVWWEGKHIGYFSDHGMITEKKNPKNVRRR